MAYPASARADLPADHPEHPGRLADPAHAAWCDYRRAVMTAVQAARLSLAELAANPGDPRNADLAESHVALMEALLGLGRRRMIDESILEAERQRAYAQGVADCKAARCRLSVIGGRPR